MVLNSMSRTKLVGIWCVAVTAISAFAIAAGAELTVGNGGWWLATCLVPPTILQLIWSGPPSLTVAELLHAVNTSPQDGPH
jgi:hypothetical protein